MYIIYHEMHFLYCFNLIQYRFKILSDLFYVSIERNAIPQAIEISSTRKKLLLYFLTLSLRSFNDLSDCQLTETINQMINK